MWWASTSNFLYIKLSIFLIFVYFSLNITSHGIQFIIYKRTMRRRTIQLAKTDPRASHLAISQGVGSIHAPFSRSLYTIRIQGCTPSQANIYIYCTIWRQERGGGGEKCAHATHFQVGTIESLSIWRRWIEITTDRNGRRKDWEVGMDGIERIRAREQSRKIVADSADLGAGDIWISTRRSWKPSEQGGDSIRVR